MTTKRSRRTINKLETSLESCNELILRLKEEKKQFTNDVFSAYLDKEVRASLIADLERTHYSQKQTNDIRDIFENYDTDTVNFSAAKSIIEAEKHVKEQTNDQGFFSKIANALLHED